MLLLVAVISTASFGEWACIKGKIFGVGIKGSIKEEIR